MIKLIYCRIFFLYFFDLLLFNLKKIVSNILKLNFINILNLTINQIILYIKFKCEKLYTEFVQFKK